MGWGRQGENSEEIFDNQSMRKMKLLHKKTGEEKLTPV